ncbi:hypothetical protein JB92DRAFT_2701156 [Gautieria morchelliformis]|nr:hypothetical protein JB92DRAFT_2701156 [Gautieria morchelliformis]
MFVNKCIFPGADASCSLGWVIRQASAAAGFEVKSIVVLGVHYSATIYRWYRNWLSNENKDIAKYGERWYRIWVYFLAYSTIITLHKNLNAYHRIEGIKNHASIKVTPKKEIS